MARRDTIWLATFLVAGTGSIVSSPSAAQTSSAGMVVGFTSAHVHHPLGSSADFDAMMVGAEWHRRTAGPLAVVVGLSLVTRGVAPYTGAANSLEGDVAGVIIAPAETRYQYLDLPVVLLVEPVPAQGRIQPFVGAGVTPAWLARCTHVYAWPEPEASQRCRDTPTRFDLAGELRAGVRYRLGPGDAVLEVRHVRGVVALERRGDRTNRLRVIQAGYRWRFGAQR